MAHDGYVAIFKKVEGKYTLISSADQKGIKMAGIYAGSETNHLQADCTGSTLKLNTQGTRAATTTDDIFTGGGVTLMAGTSDQGGTDILLGNFAIYRPWDPHDPY